MLDDTVDCAKQQFVTWPLDLIRASNVADYQSGQSQVLTVAWEPIVCDLHQPNFGLSSAKHWVIDWISFVAQLTGQAPQPAPITGLFLCPQATPTETLAQAQGTNGGGTGVGINLDARPIQIPMVTPSNPAQQIVGAGGGPYILQMTALLGFRLIVQSGYFLRAIVSCAPGTSQPGPGPASFGRLRAGVFAEVHA